MAADYLTHIDNETLIKLYEEIGYKKIKNLEYGLTNDEIFVISAISKRKLTHKTKFKFGLPKPKEMQSGIEKKYMEETFK